ncbi:MAG: hypothetical protein HY810_00420 [Candidatus Omnitrophica bacterium]|nr:hypothetical protein [Candidatus Omnitrophota bacterium]
MKNKKQISKINYFLFVIIFSLVMESSAGKVIAAGSCDIGAFLGNSDGQSPTVSQINDFENLSGRHLNSVLVYWAWSEGNLPINNLKNNIVYHDGYDTQTVLQLTWEPWSRMGSNDTSYSLESIKNNEHDQYIRQFARDLKDYGSTVRLRFAHEMIDDNNSATAGWYPWQDKPEEYKDAWEHVYDIFQFERADNVEFVWAPNHHSSRADVLSAYYPGEDKVDWLGMDGYNWGYRTDQEPWGYWLTFDDVFGEIYDTLTTRTDIFGEDKKLMIAEFASEEETTVVGKTKAEWILDAFEKIQNEYGDIDAFYWFNVLKERNWRIDSSQETLNAFQQAMDNEYYASHTVPEPSMLVLFGSGFLYMIFNKKLT